ncbi:MAG TPA: BON domain-containing protein [Pyrinomonadaceae bacterium]|nr:BON domain-containing protein [Pyrinomonadaceae bacterium]
MKIQVTGLIASAAMTLALSGCQPSTNENINSNANASLARNTNTPLPSPSPTVSETSRRAPTREEYERDKERYQREAKGAGSKVGTGLNDGWLWVKTRFDLAAADDLRDSTVNVDVDNGVVTLNGSVATVAQKTKAEAVAKSVEGVKSVKNMLKVVAANSNANTHASPTPRK